ncbi:MAG TPA: MFS transporter [Nocardioidaceae bacterium]|nr:MFS transporter [Nocardioidaceae bacterium]
MRAALRTPGFKRLYAGLCASMFGDSLMLIVLSMWVKSLTGSNGAAGLTFLWLTLPALVGPLFGYVVDRIPRRPFLVAANFASALIVLPLLLVHDAGDVWLIYLVSFCYGVSFVVIPAALNGLLKDMLAEEALVEANATLSVTREAWRLVGPLAGATAFALLGGWSVAVIDAATFVVAALAVASLTVREAPLEPASLHWSAELVAGARHIRVTPLLLHPTLAVGICLLVVGFSESAVYAVLDAFDKPVEFVGPLLTVQGVGAVVSGLLSSRVIKRVGEPRALLIGLAFMAAGLLGVVASTRIWELLVSTAVLGAGLPILIVAYSTMLQLHTPGRLMGRVSTATEVLTTTPQALSIATGALLVTLLDYRVIFGLMAAGTVAGAVYLMVALRDSLSPALSGESATPVADPDPIPGSVLAEGVAAPLTGPGD